MNNKRLLNYFRKPLKVYWWRYQYPDKLNFGDELTPLIIQKLFGRRVVWSNPEECEIAGAGSIIEILLRSKKGNRPVLWGSGFIKQDNLTISQNDFDVKALRGKYSLERTKKVEPTLTALGDPGLLADCLLSTIPKKKYILGIVPHYVDLESAIVKELSSKSGVKIISPLGSPEEVVRDIAACHYLISSSLHGLIVADSVGTPNVHVKISDKLTGGIYKFKDYYSVFTESRYVKLPTHKVIGKNVSTITSEIKKYYIKPIDLDTIKNDLVKSFPKHI